MLHCQMSLFQQNQGVWSPSTTVNLKSKIQQSKNIFCFNDKTTITSSPPPPLASPHQHQHHRILYTMMYSQVHVPTFLMMYATCTYLLLCKNSSFYLFHLSQKFWQLPCRAEHQSRPGTCSSWRLIILQIKSMPFLWPIL